MTFGEPQSLAQSASLSLAALHVESPKMVAYRVAGMDTEGVLRDRAFARSRRLLLQEQALVTPQPAGTGVPVPESELELEPNAKAISSAVREPTFLELDLRWPEGEKLLRQWVEELGGAGEGGADFARRAGAWLQQRHSYRTSMQLEPGEGDPLVRWIASNEPGHCELFAGALVLLARTAGVPARMITGFNGGVWNPTSGSITVRNSDAHAWTEIWDDRLGSWLRADATPGAQITPPQGQATEQTGGAEALLEDRGWSARMDGLKVFWYRRIVNFDQGSQLKLLRGTKEHLKSSLDGVRVLAEEALRGLIAWMKAPWDSGRVAVNLLVPLSLVAALFFWRKEGRAWWLAWRSRRAGSHRADPVRREASRWLARLARREAALRACEPRAAGQVGEEVAAAKANLLRLRFGARESWPAPVATFLAAKRACRRERL